MTPIYLVTRLVTVSDDESYSPGEVVFFPDAYNPRFVTAEGETIWAEDLRRIEYCIVIVDLEGLNAYVQPFFHDIKKEVKIRDGLMECKGKQMKQMSLNDLFEQDNLDGDGWQFVN